MPKRTKLDMCSGSLGDNPVLVPVLEKAKSAFDIADLLQYPPVLGLLETREAFRELFRLHKDHEVIVTPSATAALYLLFLDHKTQSPNGVVHVQQPCFFGVNRQLRDLGIPFETWETVDELKAAINAEIASLIYITSNIRGTNGRSMSQNEKDALAQLQSTHGCTIIEDNPNDLLVFDGTFPTRIYDESPDGTSYIGTTSKIMAPGLRLGCIAATAERIRRLKSLQIGVTIAPPPHSQLMALEALSADYIDDLRAYYKQKWLRFRSLLETYGLTSFDEVEGGIFAKVYIPEHCDIAKIVTEAASRGIQFEENKFYYTDGQNRAYLRMNFVQQSDEDNERAIKVLSEIISQYYE